MLHDLQPKQKRIHKKRVGRGGKRGTTSGKGTKGQSARAGNSKRPAEYDFIIRLPKRRGFRNKSIAVRSEVISVGDLDRLFNAGDAVTVDTLRGKGLVPAQRAARGVFRIKILSDGALTKPLTVRGLDASESAREKIIAAGGSVA